MGLLYTHFDRIKLFILQVAYNMSVDVYVLFVSVKNVAYKLHSRMFHRFFKS